MKFASVVLAVVAINHQSSAFAPTSLTFPHSKQTSTVLKGYLDDLSKELAAPDGNPNIDDDSREANVMDKSLVDRAGPGTWESYVEFNEFDGGDGQMGVAGDGNKKLEKFDMSEMAKSKTMSAKNAWGKSTGYADSLIEKGVDTARAQQLENWHNQQELLQQRKSQRWMTDEFDKATGGDDDDNWRNLKTFGVERNQNFDLNETFGAVTPADQLEGVIELSGRMNGPASVYEFQLRNPFMGFADFRAAFTAGTPSEFTVQPAEGSLRQKEDTTFMVKFKAQRPGVIEGYLVVETEDFKKTWKVVGTTA